MTPFWGSAFADYGCSMLNQIPQEVSCRQSMLDGGADCYKSGSVSISNLILSSKSIGKPTVMYVVPR